MKDLETLKTEALATVEKEATKKSPKKTAPERAVSKKPAVVRFRSTGTEPSGFDVNGITPIREPDNKHLVWEVPAERADIFERHHHVQFGRITRVI